MPGIFGDIFVFVRNFFGPYQLSHRIFLARKNFSSGKFCILKISSQKFSGPGTFDRKKFPETPIPGNPTPADLRRTSALTDVLVPFFITFAPKIF